MVVVVAHTGEVDLYGKQDGDRKEYVEWIMDEEIDCQLAREYEPDYTHRNGVDRVAEHPREAGGIRDAGVKRANPAHRAGD
jgi:hypothetical protein